MTLRQMVIYFGSIALATTILVTGITAFRQQRAAVTGLGMAPTAEIGRPAKPAQGRIAWKPSFESAVADAKAKGKPVMLSFHAGWCSWCKKLDAEVYPDAAVVAEATRFISVKVDVEKREDLAKRFKVEGLPTILWLRPDGSVIDRLPGYAEASEFAQMMRAAAAGSTPAGASAGASGGGA